MTFFAIPLVVLLMATTKEVTKQERALIFEKIPAIMAEVSAIEKSRKNPQQGYSFRGIDDMYNELHGLFAKHKVFFTSKVIHAEREERLNKAGNVMVYTFMDIEFTFFAEDGSSISSIMRGEAMDTGDKASSKAASSALKYALMQMFMIPTTEEKDIEYHSHQLGAAKVDAPKEADAKPLTVGVKLESDQRPWLNEAQFQAMMEAIQSGKGGMVLAKMENYKIRRDYRERLNEALVVHDRELA